MGAPRGGVWLVQRLGTQLTARAPLHHVEEVVLLLLLLHSQLQHVHHGQPVRKKTPGLHEIRHEAWYEPWISISGGERGRKPRCGVLGHALGGHALEVACRNGGGTAALTIGSHISSSINDR